MQSGLRFVLAWLVVIAHLTSGTPGTSHMGVYAVFGFYLLSGFLITLILNETYKSSSLAFFKNRVLRLYPVYFIIAAFTLAVITLLPDAASFKGSWAVDTRLRDIVGNLFIVPFEFYSSRFRLVPPAWSVAVELINYGLLWLLIARHRYIAFACVLLAIMFHIATYMNNPAWAFRYAPFEAAILPFSLGASVYFLKDKAALLSAKTARFMIAAALCLWVFNLLYCGFMGGGRWRFFNTSFYINMTLLGVIMWAWSHPAYNQRAKGVLKRMGDLSYPIFLIHWQVGFVVYTVLGLEQPRGWLLLALSVVPILVLAWVSLRLTDPMIEPLRDKIRTRAKGIG